VAAVSLQKSAASLHASPPVNPDGAERNHGIGLSTLQAQLNLLKWAPLPGISLRSIRAYETTELDRRKVNNVRRGPKGGLLR